MRRIRLPLGLLLTGFVLGAALAGPVETTVPRGQYHVLWFTLEGRPWVQLSDFQPQAPPQVALFIALRDGKGAEAWLCSSVVAAGTPTWLDDVGVTFDGKSVRGTVRGTHGGDLTPLEYTFDGARRDGQVSGTFSGSLGEARLEGTFSGAHLLECDMLAENAIAKGANWPRYRGTTGGMGGPEAAVPMVDDLARARPVWKSEDTVPCGWGNAPDQRYGPVAAHFKRPAGGTSTPVLADGVVYQYYYLPAGEGSIPQGWDAVWDKHKVLYGNIPYPDDARMFGAARADEVVVALDAATGRTLWRAVAPGKGYNIQTHKWRGMNPTPVVHGGVLYNLGYAGYVMALDAANGSLLWDYTGLYKEQTAYDPYGGQGAGVDSVGPVVAGGRLVVSKGRAVALDAKTGEEAWRFERGGNLVRWTDSRTGKEYVIVAWAAGEGDVAGACIDPDTGKQQFQLPREAGAAGILPLVVGDVLFGTSSWAEGPMGCFRLAPDGAAKLWEAERRTGETGVAMNETCVYVADSQGLRVYDVATGELNADVTEGDGHRTNLVFLAGDRLFVQPEGRHSGQSFKMFDLSDPADPKPLPTPPETHETEPATDTRLLWRPPHPHTTAYACQALGYPVVDGRLFVRGNAGVYCYDLRADGALKRQTIHFAEVPPQPPDAAKVELDVAASSGLALKVTVTSGPARVEDGRLALTGEPGIVRLLARQAGSRQFLPASAVERAFPVGRPIPAPPSVRAHGAASTVVEVAWDHDARFTDAFLIERSADGADWRRLAQLPADAGWYLDRDLRPQTTHHYRVTARNEFFASEPSPVAEATTPDRDRMLFLEAENGRPGASWKIVDDHDASAGKAVQSTRYPVTKMPEGPEDILEVPFEWPLDGQVTVWVRAKALASSTSDSGHLRIDDGRWQFVGYDGEPRYAWHARTFRIAAGEHTLGIGIREANNRIDRVFITNGQSAPNEP